MIIMKVKLLGARRGRPGSLMFQVLPKQVNLVRSLVLLENEDFLSSRLAHFVESFLARLDRF